MAHRPCFRGSGQRPTGSARPTPILKSIKVIKAHNFDMHILSFVSACNSFDICAAVIKNNHKMNIYGANSFRYCYQFIPKTRRDMRVSSYTINPPSYQSIRPSQFCRQYNPPTSRGFKQKMRINQVLLLLGVVLLVISSSGTTEKSCFPAFLIS